MRLDDISVRARLYGGFGVVLALLLIVAGIGLREMLHIETALREAKAVERRAFTAQQWAALSELNGSRVLALVKSGGDPSVKALFRTADQGNHGRDQPASKGAGAVGHE